MTRFARQWGLLGLSVGVVAAGVMASTPSGAISAELAKKCRELAIKAHPYQQPGGQGNAKAERDYFRECIDKNGNMPN